jgi:hypothetical protein
VWKLYVPHALPISKGTALDGAEWSASRPGRTLPPGKGPPVRTGQEAGWAPDWTQRLEEISFACAGDRTPVVQSAVRHYNDKK